MMEELLWLKALFWSTVYALSSQGSACNGIVKFVTCSSNSFKYATCTAEEISSIISVSVQNKLSSSSCDYFAGLFEDYDDEAGVYGYTGSYIWVFKGCRAKFKICAEPALTSTTTPLITTMTTTTAKTIATATKSSTETMPVPITTLPTTRMPTTTTAPITSTATSTTSPKTSTYTSTTIGPMTTTTKPTMTLKTTQTAPTSPAISIPTTVRTSAVLPILSTAMTQQTTISIELTTIKASVAPEKVTKTLTSMPTFISFGTTTMKMPTSMAPTRNQTIQITPTLTIIAQTSGKTMSTALMSFTSESTEYVNSPTRKNSKTAVPISRPSTPVLLTLKPIITTTTQTDFERANTLTTMTVTEITLESDNTDIWTVAGATLGCLVGLAAVGGSAYLALAKCAYNKVSPLCGGGRRNKKIPDEEVRSSSRVDLLPGSTSGLSFV